MGNPSTMVAADPEAPGIFSIMLAKLSPMVDATTIAVVKITKLYGSALNTSRNPHTVIRAVVAPATGINPKRKPYKVPATSQKNCSINIILRYIYQISMNEGKNT
jgi:hypothetical protein